MEFADGRGPLFSGLLASTGSPDELSLSLACLFDQYYGAPLFIVINFSCLISTFI
jgi:hypothetical protein